MIPGGSSAHVFVISSEGNLLSNTEFLTGWRIGVKKVSIAEAPDDAAETVLIETEPTVGGGLIPKQYYALTGDKIVLVRLEGPEGKITENCYAWPNHMIGPRTLDLSEKSLIDKLADGTWAEKLTALVWIGGEHLDEVPDFNVAHEDDKSKVLAKKLLSNKRVAEEVYKLTLSRNKWISELALDIRKNKLKY